MKHVMTQAFIKQRFLWVILTALLSVSDLQAATTENDAPILQSVVFLSDNLKFVEDWRTLPADDPPHIKSLKKAIITQSLYLGMLVYVPSSMSGSRQFHISMKVVAPDGQTIIDLPNYDDFQMNIPVQGGYLLVDPPLDLHFSANDIVGEYGAYVTVVDTQSGVRAYGNHHFTLIIK